MAEMASIPSGESHPWIPACARMTVVQRSPEAGTQWSGGALLSGGIHTLRQPPWRGIHILPSTPSARPPQSTVMPADGDLCVTPPVGNSVAEMASIPSGEPHPWIPACAGMTVVQRSPEAGTQWSGGHSSREASAPSVNLPGEATNTLPSTPSGRPPQPTVMPAKAGIQWSGGALVSGGIHTLGQPPRRVIHTLPSTPSARPPQPTAMPAEGGHPGGLAGHSYSGGIHTLRQPSWGGIHTLPSTPSGRPPQPAGMPAKAGTQWSGGALLLGGSHTLRQALAQGRSNSVSKFHESKRPEGLDKA